MKTNLNLKNGPGGHLRSAAAALFLFGGFAGVCQPFSSPVGTWDVVMSGCRDGVALMTFQGIETTNMISMTEVLVPKPKNSGFVEDRGLPGNSTRNGTQVTTNGLPAHTNIYGGLSFPNSDFNVTNTDVGTPLSGSALNLNFGNPAGQWGFNSAGQIIGFFTEISAPLTITTNVTVIGTNNPPFAPFDAITNAVPINLTNVVYLRYTNAISFIGKVKLGTKPKLTLVCSTPDGHSTFSGLVPLLQKDISGFWYATKTAEGLPSNEFFNINTDNPSLNNFYDVGGVGPGYNYGGIAIVSQQKKIGFAVSRILPPGSTPIVRGAFGSVDFKHFRFTSKGLENLGDGTLDMIKFNAFLSPE